MPDIFDLIRKWRKQMLVAVLLPVVLVAAIVFLQPAKWLGVAAALPANAASSDKASVFSNSIRDLYSSLGSPDDIDKIVGTAQQDTVYLAVADQFSLPAHYKLNGNVNGTRLKAAAMLKKNSKVSKSEYGELIVKAWDTDQDLAPQLANAIMGKLAAIHQDLHNESNKAIVRSLHEGRQKLQAAIDSARILNNLADNVHMDTSRLNVLKEQTRQYEKLETEYQLMIDSNPAVLVVVEKARIAERPDKPRRVLIIAATALLSIFFALLVALILERRNSLP